jgi:guanylate kinase
MNPNTRNLDVELGLNVPIIVSGYSGSGKNTVANSIARNLNDRFSISAARFTDRKMRPGEQQGVDGFFVDTEEFGNRRDSGEFLYDYDKYSVSYGFSRDILAAELSVSSIFVVGGEINTSLSLADSISRERSEGLIKCTEPIVLFVNRDINAIVESLRKRAVADAAEIERRIDHVQRVWIPSLDGLPENVVVYENDGNPTDMQARVLACLDAAIGRLFQSDNAVRTESVPA